MKYLIISLLILSAILSSCCKKIQVVPTVRFVYPLLEKNTIFNITTYFSADSIRKTNSFVLFEEHAPYIFPLAVKNSDSYYTIDVYAISFDSTIVDSTLIYADTISNVQYKLKGRCKNKLKDFSFFHNGVLKLEATVEK